MKFKTTKRLFKEGLENIFKNRLVSGVAISTVFISLTVFGLSFSAVNVINENIKNLQGQVEMVAFLENGLEEEEISDLEKTIKEISNVKDVSYTSQEKGLDEYKRSFTDDGDEEMQKILEDATASGENPIPATFAIMTEDSNLNNNVKNELSNFEEIYKVNDGGVITDFLLKINKYTKIISVVLMALLMVASILLISNTIKIAVFVRKNEISIIKYIGATNNYVRLPFIIEGFFIGIIGAVISSIIVAGVYKVAGLNITSITSQLMEGFIMPEMESIFIVLVPIMLLNGAGIGVLGSLVSIRKYLKF